MVSILWNVTTTMYIMNKFQRYAIVVFDYIMYNSYKEDGSQQMLEEARRHNELLWNLLQYIRRDEFNYYFLIGSSNGFRCYDVFKWLH